MTPLVVVVVVVVKEVDVVVDEVTWIFWPIICDENMTRKKIHIRFVSQGKKQQTPSIVCPMLMTAGRY